MDLGQLNSRAGRTIVSAAIIDDVLSLALLAVLTAMIRTGSMPGSGVLAMMGLHLVAFFGISTLLGAYVLPRVSRLFKKVRTPVNLNSARC